MQGLVQWLRPAWGKSGKMMLGGLALCGALTIPVSSSSAQEYAWQPYYSGYDYPPPPPAPPPVVVVPPPAVAHWDGHHHHHHRREAARWAARRHWLRHHAPYIDDHHHHHRHHDHYRGDRGHGRRHDRGRRW